ncbi:MAG: acetyltransferase [Candidatus Onthomonas sp.]
MSDSVIVIGGGGHAKVVIDCIQSSGGQVAGILDDGIPAGASVLGIPVLGRVSEYAKYASHPFIIAIGNNAIRRRIARDLPVRWYTAVHPSAIVSRYASVGAGTVVMPRAVINPGASVGAHCILNTGAVVEHDNRISDFVHLSPSAALGGTVSVGEGTHIGLGAAIRNNIRICAGCTIGAGAVVVKDITEPGTYIGVPAGRLK